MLCNPIPISFQCNTSLLRIRKRFYSPLKFAGSGAIGAQVAPIRWCLALFALGCASAAGAGVTPQVSACLQQAAQRYHVPEMLLTAIRLQEGGQPGMANRNTNGSVDYGVMQINSIHLSVLSEAGYTADVLRWNVCANIRVAAWILAKEMKQDGVWVKDDPSPRDYWRAVGAYHSRTPRLNRQYAKDVWQRYQQLTGAPQASGQAAPQPPLVVYSMEE